MTEFSVHVIGCGEAMDPGLANSAVVVAAAGFRLLVDCGHSVPGPLFASYPDPEAVDAIYFTHHHPDHCFGLVPVMVEWADRGRVKPLAIFTTAEGRARLLALSEVGLVAPLERKLTFPVTWPEIPAATAIGPFAASFASTHHGVVNHAVRLEHKGRVLAYSGDGRASAASRRLFAGADLLFHECYQASEADAGDHHFGLDGCLAVASEAAVGRLVVYHVRAEARATVAAALAASGAATLAGPGDRFIVGA